MRKVFYTLLLLLLPQLSQAWESFTVSAAVNPGRYGAEATLEAVRQAQIAAQVPAQVLAVTVQTGDVVRRGQLLVRLDGATAQQSAAASLAMTDAARAQLHLAQRDYQRQQQLFAAGYISQAALDRASSQFRVAQAQAAAGRASAKAASASADYYALRAPYDGLVSAVNIKQGDMVMPGQPLLTVYDSSQFRVVAQLPQSLLPMLQRNHTVSVELPADDAAARWLQPTQVVLSPAADPLSHTVSARLELAAHIPHLLPGSFARAWFDCPGCALATNVRIPARAVLQRSELTAVYVLEGIQPQLRQIRLGTRHGEWVEVSAGLSAGDRVLLDPLAAANAGREIKP